MAAPSGSLPVGRYLGALAGILVVLYALVFFTGDSSTPKLGLDLEGGTQVTLQAQTTDNQPPSSAALDQARQIIERRVNGLGVAEAEVVTESPDRIVISVPGANGDAAKSVGQTAQLRLRPVISSAAAAATPPAGSATPSASTSGSASPAASASASAPPSGSATPQGFAPAPTRRPGSAAGRDRPGRDRPRRRGAPDDPAGPASTRSSTRRPSPTSQKLTCAANSGASASLDKPTDVIASCDQNGGSKYLLNKAIIEGTEIAGAAAVAPTSTSPQWTVSLDFKGSGQATWARYTSQHNVTVHAERPGQQRRVRAGRQDRSRPRRSRARSTARPRSPAASPRARPRTWPTCSSTARCR